MDDLRFAALVRRLRIRAQLRQLDLGRLARVSRSTVSRIERGHLGTLSVDVVRRVAAVLEIRVDLVPRWRGGDLDRVLNARHARLHELVARHLVTLPSWRFLPEVSFAIYRERGVIDILCFHSGRNALLVIELKTDIVDVNELVGTLDRKLRLAVEIARERGWPVTRATTVSAWVIVAEGRTNRRRVSEHRTMLRAAFPTDGRSIAGWLANPARPIRALSFWPDAHSGNVGTGLTAVRRVQRRRDVAGRAPGSVRSPAAGRSGRVRADPTLRA
jgi:transcriptional regulator with XRE-family HTH domain